MLCLCRRTPFGEQILLQRYGFFLKYASGAHFSTNHQRYFQLFNYLKI